MTTDRELIGLFPAGGLGKRLGASVDCSKEIIPVPDQSGRLKPVGAFLLEAYKQAGIDSVIVITRAAKQDIAERFGDGRTFGLQIRYLTLSRFWGTPFTLDEAWPLIRDKNVALGFPDIILQPLSTFATLQARFDQTDADVLLGLFRTDKPEKADMVEYAADGAVSRLHIKQNRSSLTHTWVTALWRPAFSAFMHDYLKAEQKKFQRDENRPEPFVGTVINAAIDCGLRVDSLVIDQGRILDIGTPEDLALARSGAFFNT
ncbi:MAG: hypothetical protein KDJ38_06875 [Gammaproteobacteria bacterium]|nr:hypothetical protein [Gammaproteobacteria bacterium]